VPVYIIIGANSDSIYKRMMTAIGRSDLIGPRFEHNHHRVTAQSEVEEAISNWTKTKTVEEAEAVFREASVPAGRVFNVEDILELEHTKARGMVEEVRVEHEGKEGWTIKIPRMYPLLEGSEANTRWAGPELGQHTEEVLIEDLGLSPEELEKLKGNGILG
jgi:crotonobetainyl-CoA:carnitine CoA-transferase CaiB-like acyl-CoA transferase